MAWPGELKRPNRATGWNKIGPQVATKNIVGGIKMTAEELAKRQERAQRFQSAGNGKSASSSEAWTDGIVDPSGQTE